MEKIKLNEKAIKNVEIEFNGQNIEVKPYFEFNDQFVLISTFLDAYFNESNFGSPTDSLSATYTNKLAILDRMTNIDIEQVKIDVVIGSGLWDKIREVIRNYSEYENNLNDAVEGRKSKNDLSGVVKSFIDTNLIPALNKFSETDILDEKLSETKALVGDLKNQLNNTPVGKLITTGVAPVSIEEKKEKETKNVVKSTKSTKSRKTKNNS